MKKKIVFISLIIICLSLILIFAVSAVIDPGFRKIIQSCPAVRTPFVSRHLLSPPLACLRSPRANCRSARFNCRPGTFHRTPASGILISRQESCRLHIDSL
jgi:hypothetical protein